MAPNAVYLGNPSWLQLSYPSADNFVRMEHINLSQETIEQYEEAFSLFDEDGDGQINISQFTNAIKNMKF